MDDDALLSMRRLRAWLRLLRLTRSTENHLREFLRVNFSTTLPRFDVAAALYRQGEPVKMSELSKQLLVSNGNVTAVVERMETDGLACRTPSEQDRRIVLVSLTDQGRSQFEVMARAHQDEVNRLFDGLDAQDLDMARDLLRRIGPDT